LESSCVQILRRHGDTSWDPFAAVAIAKSRSTRGIEPEHAREASTRLTTPCKPFWRLMAVTVKRKTVQSHAEAIACTPRVAAFVVLLFQRQYGYYGHRKGNCGAITEPDLFSPHVIHMRAEQLFTKRRSDAICPLIEMPVDKDVHSSLPVFQTVSYNSFNIASLFARQSPPRPPGSHHFERQRLQGRVDHTSICGSRRSCGLLTALSARYTDICMRKCWEQVSR
jgi:hypothetical protein